MIDPASPDYSNTPVCQHRPCFGYALAEGRESPQVSVVTPFYNTREVFEETAACVLRQSLQQWEWIIVNDASTDPAALAILDRYRASDARIRVIDNRVNLGLPGARNVGFRAATSQYVFLLDDDDLIEATALEKLYWFLESNPQYAMANAWTVGFSEQQYLWPKGFDAGEQILKSNCVTSLAMVRRSAHELAGGYDEALQHGFEDWDFWLKLASQGFWGGTVPEYLLWYRRRSNHGDRWQNLESESRSKAFVQLLRQRYADLYEGGFPQIEPRWPTSFETVLEHPARINQLARSRPRVLMLLPWLTTGGADKFNLDLLEQLNARGYEVTIACTMLTGDNSWLPEFARFTPDIFILQHFLRPVDYPAFLRYLIDSRQPEVVLISNSEFGYLLLPYLRSVCPAPAYLDYCHMEEEHWRNGGYPRFAASLQELLDQNIVSSQHLKDWMVRRGADPGQIEVCYTNIDPAVWSFSGERRDAIRSEQGIGPGQAVILYAARLCPQKKPHVLARVVQELAGRGLDFVTLVAGNGDKNAWLKSFVAENRLEAYIRLLGAVPNTVIKDLMSACDIFFLPSQWEGIALSVYEAMACGRAVVGADVGGQRELVTPDCGILLPTGEDESEVQAYADVLASLLTDTERVRDMGRRARERIAGHFTLEQMAERMVDLLKNARQRRSLPPLTRGGLGGSALILSQRLALELAAQAVELRRTADLGEQLWKDRDELGATLDRHAARIKELEAARHASWEESQRRIAELDEALRRSWEDGQRLAQGWEAQGARIRELEALRDRLWSELQEFKSQLEQVESQRAALGEELATLRGHWAYRLMRRVAPGALSRSGNGSAPPGA